MGKLNDPFFYKMCMGKKMQHIFYINSNLDIAQQKAVLVSYAQDQNITGEFITGKEVYSLCSIEADCTIYISEMLSLAPTLDGINKVLKYLMEQNCAAISVQEGYKISPANGKDILQGMEMAIAISSRNKSLMMKKKLAQKRKNGGVVGRHLGAKNIKPSLCEQNKDFILQALSAGEQRQIIAQKVGVSVRTLFNFIHTIKNEQLSGVR